MRAPPPYPLPIVVFFSQPNMNSSLLSDLRSIIGIRVMLYACLFPQFIPNCLSFIHWGCRIAVAVADL